MITYNNIVTKFQEFVDNHFFLKTFTHGSPADVDLDKFTDFPLLHLVYVGGNYANNVKTYNLEVYVLDNPVRDEDKTREQKSVISATEQVAEDILADIENGGNIFQFGYQYEIQSANINPLENKSTNLLAGSLLTLSIGVAYTYDSCNAPLSGVEPEGSVPQPFVTRGLLRVREEDGTPDVTSVATMVVPNGSLTDDGNGQISLEFASGEIALDDLTDVDIAGVLPLNTRDVLMYLGAPINQWVNIPENTMTVLAANSANQVPWTGVQQKGSVTDLSDVTSAGSGAIITDAERTKLEGLTPGGDSSAVKFQIRNDEGAIIAAGTPLYSKGEIGGSERILVGIAQASDPTKMPAIGIAETELTTASDGRDGDAVLVGTYNTNISGFTGLVEGDVLYVASGGGLTKTKPTGTDLIQNVGIVLKTNNPGTILQGLKVACIGRTNDVPNLPDGKFFIGSATNTQTSSYGLPTSDPSDGDSLVYNSANDAFEAGYPTATGQVSSWVCNSTNTQNITTTGSVSVEFGSVLSGSATFVQNCRAGWNMGINVNGTQLLAAPVGIRSTIDITVTVRINAPVGALGQLQLVSKVGWFSAPGLNSPIFQGNGVETEYQITTSTTGDVRFWQLANSAVISMNILANPGTIIVKPQSIEIEITHA